MASGPTLKWLLIFGSIFYIVCVLGICIKLDSAIKSKLGEERRMSKYEAVYNKEKRNEIVVDRFVDDNNYNNEDALGKHYVADELKVQQESLNKSNKDDNQDIRKYYNKSVEAGAKVVNINYDTNKEGHQDINVPAQVDAEEKKVQQDYLNITKNHENHNIQTDEDQNDMFLEENTIDGIDHNKDGHRDASIPEQDDDRMDQHDLANTKKDMNSIDNFLDDHDNKENIQMNMTENMTENKEKFNRENIEQIEHINDHAEKQRADMENKDNKENIENIEKVTKPEVEENRLNGIMGNGSGKLQLNKDKRTEHPTIKINDQDLAIPHPIAGLDDDLAKYFKLAEKLDFRDPNGPGEGANAVEINRDELSDAEKEEFDKGWKDHAYNLFASDRISLHRQHPPIQDECRQETYRPIEELPSASIVIIFHNEAWSVLLRTLYSVIERSPSQLLTEIILVDDCSTFEHLHKPLDVYVKKLSVPVKIVRSPVREGLIKARLLGAEVAEGDALIFLDSHVEAFEGWMEPLLDRIAANWTNVATPVIDAIKDDNFQFIVLEKEKISVGGFSWTMAFNWIPTTQEEQEKRRREGFSKPIPSPTMAGGLFAISRKYFYYLGTYDPDFKIWGGENTEISFRIWMCGGTLELIPCSHVAHIFRKRTPYSWGDAGIQAVVKNMARVAEIWLDEYKPIFYEITHINIDFGDVSERIALKKQLQCKNFSWYLKNIMPEFYVPTDKLSGYGEVKNVDNSKLCIDGPGENQPVIVYDCHGLYGNQGWYLSDEGEIKHAEVCLTTADEDALVLKHCHGNKGDQHWEYVNDLIRSISTYKCLELSSKRLILTACEPSNTRQQWLWKKR